MTNLLPSTRQTRSIPTRRVLAAVVVVFASGCVSPLDVPTGRLIEPPPEYRIWWDEVERCVGERRDFYEVEWFTGAPTDDNGDELTGVWSAPRFIVLRPFYLTSEPAVKHEMLHHLTRGKMPHSAAQFSTCTRPIGARMVISLGG